MANRDPEATKARILAAAVREFSAKGISGARVDAIAARARGQQADALLLLRVEGRALPRDPPPPPRTSARPTCAATWCPTPIDWRSVKAGWSTRPSTHACSMWEALETNPTIRSTRRSDAVSSQTWIEAVEDEQRAGQAAGRPRRRAARAQRGLPDHGTTGPAPAPHAARDGDVRARTPSSVARPPGVPARCSRGGSRVRARPSRGCGCRTTSRGRSRAPCRPWRPRSDGRPPRRAAAW